MVESHEELRRRVGAFMDNGGGERLAAAIAVGKAEGERIKRDLTPDPAIMRLPMTI